ncbi:MAG: NnrS family protein [bacterium]
MTFVQFPPPVEARGPWPAILAVGFRPFFFLAGIAAVVLVALWLGILAGKDWLPGYYDMVTWHGHEMIFGYAGAVIAGFLLTAAKNWTGIQTARHGQLLVLVLLWLGGRVAPFLFELPWLVATIDLLFLPALTISLAIPLIKARQYNNLVFIPLLGMMFIANALVHARTWGVELPLQFNGLNLGLDLVVVIMTIMGGRVIPFFIERGVADGSSTVKRAWVEWLTMVSMVVFLLVHQLSGSGWLFQLGAALAGVTQLIRWLGWYLKGVWKVPIAWVLFVAYGWIPVGLLLYSSLSLWGRSAEFALHSLAVGALGMLTLGMMARVSLGHTGRQIGAHWSIVVAFLLVCASAVARVFLTGWAPEGQYMSMINIAGNLWIGAFVLFLVRYTVMFWKPRIDGRPGNSQ